MAINRRRKGKRIQRKFRDYMQNRGYKIELQKDSLNTNNDFFGEFDAIALKRGEKPIFVQVKSNQLSQYSEILEFSKENLSLSHCRVWLAAWEDYHGWWVKELKHDEWVTIIDER